MVSQESYQESSVLHSFGVGDSLCMNFRPGPTSPNLTHLNSVFIPLLQHSSWPLLKGSLTKLQRTHSLAGALECWRL